MDSKIFKYFIVLEENSNFSRAAQELYLSPQGLNSAMKRLEGEIGFPLFIVKNGSVQLTDYGKMFSTYAHTIEATLTSLHNELDSLAAHKANNIRIGCATGVLGYFGSDNLFDFNSCSNNARITLIEEVPDYFCEQHLMESKYDFALITNPITSPELISISLCEDYQFIWVNVQHPLASKKQLDIRDLAGEKIMTMDQAYKNTTALEHLREREGIDVDISYSGEMMSIYEYARKNEGLGLTCRNHGENIESSTVVCIPFQCLPWGFSLSYSKNRLLSEADQQFIAYMRARRRVFA